MPEGETPIIMKRYGAHCHAKGGCHSRCRWWKLAIVSSWGTFKVHTNKKRITLISIFTWLLLSQVWPYSIGYLPGQRLIIESVSFFFTFRGQIKLKPHPDWSFLGIKLNSPTSIPKLFTWESPLTQDWIPQTSVFYC